MTIETMLIDATRNPVVFIKDGEAFASSRDIADSFGKEHRSVLVAIDNLLEQAPDLRLHDFVQTIVTRPNPKGGAEIESRAFDLTRDGFTLLAMRFTGAKALAWQRKYIAAFNVMEAELRADGKLPGHDTDLLADFSHRVHGELVEYRGFISKEVGGIRGAVLHYVKEYVVNPLAGMRQYLDDRFRAIHQRDAMLLGHAANTTAEMQATRKEVGTVLTMARRSLDPEAFIRPEWCDIDDIYVLVGFDHVPRRGSLSATVSRSLDAFCKENNRQQDMRTWRHAGRNASYWRKTAVMLWLKSQGAKMIKAHCVKHAVPAQGVIPFRKPEGA